MATRGQITEKAVLVHDDEYRKTFPVESYVDETYWADLPFAQRVRWMLSQQVISIVVFALYCCVCAIRLYFNAVQAKACQKSTVKLVMLLSGG